MKIHAIETGKVKITRNWQVGQSDGIERMGNMPLFVCQVTILILKLA